ncbi:MAG: hypothetical protein WBA93_29860 [Microcoleaceae cyanobacterium]
MATLKRFNTPALIKDLADKPEKQAELDALWNQTINDFTERSIQGQNAPLDNDRAFYFNPLTTDMTTVIAPPPVGWTAFPNRILVIFPNASRGDQLRYADEGPPNLPNGDPYRPEGPRGWQDEYCEWSVTRRPSDNKITKVTFTCENLEYWNALWLINRNRVVELYRELVSPDVQLSDLEGETDPHTGLPSYNHLNKWNNSTTSGAVHLVSGPNTLGAQIELAAAATIIRECNGEVVTNQSQLIQCSRYGTPGRNSDPFIGGTVNSIVRQGGVKVTLQDPVGLYIQQPDFLTWELPVQAPTYARPSDYWKVVRGHRRTDPNEPDFILHAVYEVPEDQGFCVGDIVINGAPIMFG